MTCTGCFWLSSVPDQAGRWWCAIPERHGWLTSLDRSRCAGAGYQPRHPQTVEHVAACGECSRATNTGEG